MTVPNHLSRRKRLACVAIWAADVLGAEHIRCVEPLPSALETAGPRSILSGDLASAPESAPAAVKAAIAAANSITATPYVWGGGHGSFYSYGYDCSGAVSFALHGGGLLSSPLDSTGFEVWGESGGGNWITVFANSGHAWAYIAGLRWDTGGPGGGSGPAGAP